MAAPGKRQHTVHPFLQLLAGYPWLTFLYSGHLGCTFLQISREGITEHKVWHMPVWTCPCLEQEGSAINGDRIEKMGG